MPWGEYYRESLERQMKPWLTKLYGFHLLKIGNLSAEINTEACAISHQVNVSLQGNPVQVKADPLHLPFAEKSVDACLLAHTLPWCSDPHRLLREADRVLIDDGLDARAGVVLGALAAHGKAQTVTDTPVTTDIHQSFDVHLNA